MVKDPNLVHIYLLTSDQKDGQSIKKSLLDKHLATVEWMNPTRNNFMKAFQEVQEARLGSNDILLLFLAGHGRMLAEDYAYLTSDFTGDERDDVKTRLSTSDLSEQLSNIRASHTIVILDSCNSGSFITGRNDHLREALDTEQQKLAAANAISFNGGTYILSAAGANEHAYGGGPLGHGFLTSALILSMRENTQASGMLLANDWLDHAAKKTAMIARGFQYLQNPPETKPGGDLQVAVFNPRDISCLPNLSPRPVMIPPILKDKNEHDSLQLEMRLRALIQKSNDSTQGQEMAPLFYEDQSVADHIEVTGHYQVSGKQVVVKLTMVYGNINDLDQQVEVPAMSFTGTTLSDEDKDALAAKITAFIYDYARSVWSRVGAINQKAECLDR